MYSMVLMAALTTGQATPDCWFKCGYCGYGGGYGCYGCWGCYGGCYGCWGYGGGYGCWGCWGCYGCHGCYGCYGCWGCYGAGAPSYVVPGGPAAEPAPAPREDKDKKSMAPSKAKLIVSLPADAKLYIDDQLMKTTSDRRVFNTPTLDKDQTYYYVLKAEVNYQGKTYTETKRVLIRAGEQVRASFPELAPEAIAAREREGATARR